MIYAIYRKYEEEPNKWYYWGRFETQDVVKMSYACFELGKLPVKDIKIITYDCVDDIKYEIEEV